jgi:hypothetical protein
MLDTLVRHLHMVRLTIAFATIAMLTMGCTGLIDDGGSGGLTGEQKVARQKFTKKALPRLNENCTVCHNGSRLNIGFLVGSSDMAMRESLVGFDPAVINLEAPTSSRLLTKGLHEGPALQGEQASDILEWLQSEREAAPDFDGPRLETPEFSPLICTAGQPGEPTCPVNTVALDAMGIAGARIDFVAQSLSSGLYVRNLKLVPGAGGAFIEHPLFVSWPLDADPVPDSIDRFFNVKMNLSPTATAEEQQIAGGTAAFIGFSPADSLTIHFKTVDVYQTDTGGGGGGGGAVGCKELASFKANAQQPINNACASCHAGANPNATSAMNITGIGAADDTMIQRACNQVRTRVNFQTIDQSGIYVATVPGNTNHPFTFNGDINAHNAFKGAVNVWVNAEKVAP